MGEPAQFTEHDGSVGGGDNGSYDRKPAPTSGYGPAASGSSLASIGFSAYGKYLEGRGAKAADEYKAERLERAAQIGRAAATQSGAQYSEELATTLGNIDSIRAAARTDPTSPTGVAVRDRQEMLGMRAKATDRANREAQIEQQETDARYLRYAGKQAMLGGTVGAFSTIFKGLSQMGQGGASSG